ncbi:HRDC domain-containing protein [Paenibacillus macerans]|uniref:HRDC domain-containing protein n=1 Tax=Paenibacillus macerans TaxID=44252 RepID=UPI003D2BF985
MRIVFLNSLEKKRNGALMTEAQVWIGEEEGQWRMGWNELTADGEQEHLWYEGASWSEMLHVYRHRLAVKLGEGFRPVMEGIWDEKEQLRGRGMAAQKLICYSELNANEPVYNELCVWRRKKAAADRKAPYLIASNRLLRMISTFLPHTAEELLQLPGVGENKAAEFGAEVLDITEKAERTHDFRWIGWSGRSMMRHSGPGYISRRKSSFARRWKNSAFAARCLNPWPQVQA